MLFTFSCTNPHLSNPWRRTRGAAPSAGAAGEVLAQLVATGEAAKSGMDTGRRCSVHAIATHFSSSMSDISGAGRNAGKRIETTVADRSRRTGGIDAAERLTVRAELPLATKADAAGSRRAAATTGRQEEGMARERDHTKFPQDT